MPIKKKKHKYLQIMYYKVIFNNMRNDKDTNLRTMN